MKITFFKNESHFYPRMSYTWENAEKVNCVCKFQRIGKSLSWLSALPVLFFAILFSQQIITNYLIFIGILVFILPLHELCHAVFCWLSGRSIERICFFPYKQVWTSKTAYVVPAFGVWRKYQAILFVSLPILLLTVLPIILAVFLLHARTWLLYLSLLNFAVSSFDITDVLDLFELPKDSLYFGTFSLTAKDSNEPVVIHQLKVTPKLAKIHHRQFEYFNGKLIEKEHVDETNATRQLRQEFSKQFGIKD